MSSTLPQDAVLAVLAVRPGSPNLSYKRAGHVYDALYQSIVNGYLAPGTKLPSEAELAAHFKVSRPVIREALLHLREDALVESLRGSGSFVLAPSEAVLTTPTPGMDISHILHGVELRAVIEPESAALAAMRRTREDLRQLAATVDAFAVATAAGEPTHAHDYGFHEAIARATANPRLLKVIQSLEYDVSHAVQVWRHLGRMTPGMRLQDAVDEHRAVLECIRHQDAEGARRAMRSHIEKTRVRMTEQG